MGEVADYLTTRVLESFFPLMNAIARTSHVRAELGSNRLRLSMGELNRNAKEIFPRQVIDQFEIRLDPELRDQHGLLWQDATNGPLGSCVNAVRTFAAIVLSDFNKVQLDLWQAFTESLEDPLVAFIAMQRGQDLNPSSRHNITRSYFEGVVLHPFGTLQRRMRKLVLHVNQQHERVGVRDATTQRVRPDMQRSFKRVTSLFIDRVQSSLAKHGGRPMEVLGSSVEQLFNGADVELGMPIAPVKLRESLDVDDRIIESSRAHIAAVDPALSRLLADVGHREGAIALEAAAKSQHVTFEELASRLRPKTRERLSI